MNILGHFINGCSVPGEGRVKDLFDPALGERTHQVALADQALVESAIRAAHEAFPAWRDTPPLHRARIMFRFKQLLEENIDLIATMITNEHGKVIDDARGEIGRGIENVEYACGVPELLKGDYTKNVSAGIDSWSEFQSLGVVAGITPFNFPAMVPLWMYPIAIACGNTFVLKPSETDPSAASYIAQLMHEAGLPPGVLNVINGDKEAVDVLLTDPLVKAVSFVGSTQVAETIYSTGAAHGKRVQALGGAKNHAVVMPDADLDSAVNAIMGAAYGSCGERCMAISVVVAVGNEVADTLVDKLIHELQILSVGPGTDPESDMGPVVTAPHRQKILDYIDTGLEESAELVVDGRDCLVADHENGFFLGASLFDKVKPHMRIYKEEIFGPVLCVVRVESLDSAMQLIDAHEYGNGTCIFTRDGEAARYFSDNIDVGMVGVNLPLPVPVAYHSFGGFKRSMFGDLAAYGPDAVRFYTKRKTVTQRWPGGGVREKAQFSFPSS